MRARTRRVGTGAVALLLFISGCGDDDDTGTVEEGATTTAAPSDEATTTTAAEEDEEDEEADGGSEGLDVTAVDFAFEGLPDEVNGGAVEIRFANEGEVDHEIAFVEIGDEANAETFFDDFGPVITEGGPFPEYVGAVVGANEAPPGETATFTYTLPEGTYMVFCSLTGTPDDPESEEGAPHFAQGMQQVVSVSEAAALNIPEGDGTITASDYTFEVDLASGDSLINFTNEGPNDHFAGFDRFPEGTTVEEAESTFLTLASLEEGEAPPEGTPEMTEVGFSGIASQGETIQFEVDALEPGTYVFYCFISDRAGGPPHAIAYEMVEAFEIT